jgi:DNA polymerase III alpha subunit (gram-positive type)
MLVLGYDTETTGLDTAKDLIIEVGAMLYDTVARQPVRIFDVLIRPPEQFPEGYVSPTGIKGEWLLAHGWSFPDAMGEVQRMIAAMPDPIIVAHNGNNYDKPITMAELARNNIVGHGLESSHWIDTRQDLPFKKEPKSRSLVHLAADHRFLNPFEHRAIFDVCTMMKVFDEYPLEEILAISRSPLIAVRALITGSPDDTAKREFAKLARFRFNEDGKKLWKKEIRECNFEREVAAAAEKGFTVVRLT